MVDKFGECTAGEHDLPRSLWDHRKVLEAGIADRDGGCVCV